METKRGFDLGVMFRREHAPEDLPDFARRAEEAGFDELWVVEDCFYASGIASAAVALACTDSIRVGLGIMPAVVRNPVFAAMEVATLARLFPGRFLPGIGHGVARWMRQVGAFPRSQLQALEEVTLRLETMIWMMGGNLQLELNPPGQASAKGPWIPKVSYGVFNPTGILSRFLPARLNVPEPPQSES